VSDVEVWGHSRWRSGWSPGCDVHGKQLLKQELARVRHAQRLHVIAFAAKLQHFESEGSDDEIKMNVANWITWHMPSHANNPHFSHTCT
jgi:hypothetical protein